MSVILITGASSGIGQAAAEHLLALGHTVYGAARRTDRLAVLAQAQARLAQGKFVALALDVTDEAAMQRGVDEVIAAEGRLDVLVNNAGYGEYGALEDMPLERARYQFDVNVFGLARLTQLVLPHMRAQGSGRIVNVSSMGGRFGEPHGAWYHGTKFAVEGLSDSLRMELAQFGIDVVVIQPGAIKTEWNAIARDKLIATSGSTAYATLAHKHATMLADADKRGSEASLVGRTIAKAATTKRPRTRYKVGSGAVALTLLASVMPDRWFDRIMLGAIR